jgi:hypothetical protein
VPLHILKSRVYISVHTPAVVIFSWFSSISPPPTSLLAGQYLKLHRDSLLQLKKGKAGRVQYMKSHKGRGGLAVLILNLCTGRSSGVTAQSALFTNEEVTLPSALFSG